MHTSSTTFLCFLVFLTLWAKHTTAKISLDSSLTAGDGSLPPWISDSGDFAFGFQQPQGSSGGFLLAIWYNKIPDKTITWSANGDNLAQKGSKLSLSGHGLVLSDPNGIKMWNAAGNGTAYADILDIGDFVIGDINGKILWQSFDNPTDTILPSQTMALGTQLIARFSDTNYSSGRFKLAMQTDGNFVAYTINWPQTSINYGHYFDTPWSYTIGTQLVYNTSGLVYIIGQKGNVLGNIMPSQVFSTQYQYQRAILEYDGVFRKYVYPVPSSSAKQSMNWIVQEFVPKNICNQVSDIGGGPCGFNSYCQMGDDKRPKCSCIPGYSLFDDTDYMRGCKRDFTAQSCFNESGQFDLQVMDSTTFQRQDFESFLGIPESDCRDSCLFDCLCAAVVIDGKQCWKKEFPLINGWAGIDVDKRTYVKVGRSNSTTIHKPSHRKERRVINGLFGGSVFLNIFLLLLFALVAKLCTYGKGAVRVKQDIAGTSMINFSFKELEEATNGFEEIIGRGAFAAVYKGTLDIEQGRFFAVKKLHDSIQDSQTEFEREVKAIARTGHQNLVQLVGFCNEDQHRLLVYEYMPNGSLADILFGDKRPNWSTRVKFALETALGLNYLHEECGIQIIHCDIKPQNILLDGSFTTRISDFGLAKLMKKDQTHTLTGLRGTKGYVAPEWFRSMPITSKVDVYSYGILLLEIICCRRCYVADLEDESRIVLADWAFDCCREGRVDLLVEGDDEAQTDIDKVMKYVKVALCCIQEDPLHRPSMNEVVQMIKGEIEKVFPRDLSSYFGSLNDGYNDVLSFGVEKSYPSTSHKDL